MSRLINPQIRGARSAGAWSSDDWHDRLIKYIPVEIASAYPIIENIVQQHATSGKPLLGLPAITFAWLIFTVLLVLNLFFLSRAYQKALAPTAPAAVRLKVEVPHLVFSTVAYLLWTYAIKSTIWLPWYDADLALIFTILFGLAASAYTPNVTTDQAQKSGMLRKPAPSAGAAQLGGVPAEPAAQLEGESSKPAAEPSGEPLKPQGEA